MKWLKLRTQITSLSLIQAHARPLYPMIPLVDRIKHGMFSRNRNMIHTMYIHLHVHVHVMLHVVGTCSSHLTMVQYMYIQQKGACMVLPHGTYFNHIHKLYCYLPSNTNRQFFTCVHVYAVHVPLMQDFDCCCLTLQPCRNPVLT